MTNAPVQGLLNQATALFHRYLKINELTGEQFNVFRILRLDSAEVRMHSAFLAELLNPKGSHGQNDIFLKLFMEKFCYRQNDFDTNNCEVRVEKYIGAVNHEDAAGGRIDIYLKDKKGKHIVIENKIYASDQLNQLIRYHNHTNQADLFYLTLEGTSPLTYSKGQLVEGSDFKCLSYKEDMLSWLEACRKEVVVLPIIREAITHYINLIKHLTNQTTNNNMEQELTALMKTNLQAAFAIAGNLHHATQQVANEFGQTVTTAFAQRGLNCEYTVDFGKNYTGIWLAKDDWKYIRIGFQFHAKNRNMIYGLTINGTDDWKKPMPIPDELMVQLKGLPNNEGRQDGWWPWFNNVEEPYRDWSNHQAYEAIRDGRMLEMLIEKTELMLAMTQGIDL